MTAGDSLRWIGEHTDEDMDFRSHGMRGGISLTAVRGTDLFGFLVRLGADCEQLERRVPFKERYGSNVPGVHAVNASLGMYGTCGEWGYVLENIGQATLFQWNLQTRYGNPEPYPEEEEVICLTLNQHDAPSLIMYLPGDGQKWEAEFCSDLTRTATSYKQPKVDATGRVAALDESLRAAGAVWPTYLELGGTDQWIMYMEEHRDELAPAVFEAIGAHFGLSIDQATVEAGDLPLVVFPRDF